MNKARDTLKTLGAQDSPRHSGYITDRYTTVQLICYTMAEQKRSESLDVHILPYSCKK